MKIELCYCITVLLGEIADRRITQKSLALTYAMAIQSSEMKNWKKINDAIIERWSVSGLERIKRMAWKRIEARHV
jgi:hypothetical protein